MKIAVAIAVAVSVVSSIILIISQVMWYRAIKKSMRIQEECIEERKRIIFNYLGI